MAVEQALVADELGVRVTVLARLAAETFRVAELPDLLAVAGALIVECCPLDHLTIGVLVDDGEADQSVDLVSFDGTGAPKGPPATWPAAGLAVPTAAASGELIYEPAVDGSPYPDLVPLATVGMASAVVVPMRSGTQAIGAVVAARRSVGFEGPDLMILDEVAAVLASALELQRTTEIALRAETERHKAALLATRRADEIAALEAIAGAFDRFELAHAVGVLAAELASLRGIELCRVAVVDHNGQLVEVAASSCQGARFGLDDRAGLAPDARAVATGELVLWRRPEPDDEAVLAGLNRLGVTSVFGLPVLWEGQVVAAIMAGSTGGHRLVTDEHLVVAGIAAQLLVRAAGGAEGLQRLVARPAC